MMAWRRSERNWGFVRGSSARERSRTGMELKSEDMVSMAGVSGGASKAE